MSGFKITTLHAFIATEPDGTEGIVGALLPNGTWSPFIGADQARVESLRPVAQEIQKRAGCPMVLAKFSVREDIEEVKS